MRLHTTHGLVSLSLSRGERLAERLAGVWPLPMVRLDQPGPHGERLRICFQVGAREVHCLLCELPPEPDEYAEGVLALLIEGLQDALRSVASLRMRGFVLPCASIRETEEGVVVGLALFLPGERLDASGVSPLGDTYLAKFATSVAGAQLPPFATRKVVPRLQAGAIRLDMALVDGQPLLLALPLPSETVEPIAFDAIESWAEFGLREIAWAPAVPQELTEEQAAALRGEYEDSIVQPSGRDDDVLGPALAALAPAVLAPAVNEAPDQVADVPGDLEQFEAVAVEELVIDGGSLTDAPSSGAAVEASPFDGVPFDDALFDDADEPPPTSRFMAARVADVPVEAIDDGVEALPDHWPNTRVSGMLASTGGAVATPPTADHDTRLDPALLLDADLDGSIDPDAQRDLEEAVAVEVTLDADLDGDVDSALDLGERHDADGDLHFDVDLGLDVAPAGGADAEAESEAEPAAEPPTAAAQSRGEAPTASSPGSALGAPGPVVDSAAQPLIALDAAEVESWIAPLQAHAFGRLVRIGPDAFVGEMISAAVLALVQAGQASEVTAALGPVNETSVAMPGFLGVEQLIRGADGVTTALAVRVAGGLDCHRLSAAADRLRGGAGRLVAVDLIERPEIELPGWSVVPLVVFRPMFAAAAKVNNEGAAVFASWLSFVDAWVQLGACATAAVRGDARLLREPLRTVELLHGFERRLLFGVVDVVAAQLGVHGVPIVAQLPQLPHAQLAAARVEPCVVVIDEVVEARPALELAIVDPVVGFASGVRWRSGSLQLFADVLQRDRHGVAVSASGTSRRNDFLHGLADSLGVARTTITDLPTASSRAIGLGRSDLFTGAARSALIGRCIETLWVLWERHGELRTQATSVAELFRDATDARR